jgi:hypothetical protein
MSSRRETTGKTTGPAVGDLVPQPHGGALRNGGTNKGGRPPNEFKEAMRALADRDDIRAYTERCLKGEFGPKFHMQALAYVTDRGYGKAAQPIVGEDGSPPVRMIVEFVDPPNADES